MTDAQIKSGKEKAQEYPGGGFNPPEQGVPHYVKYMDRAEAGFHAIKMLVYAGMTAFVILASFGFYLIYQLTNDAQIMAEKMQEMSNNMQAMTVSVTQINQSTLRMADSVTRMQYATTNMDRAFSTPMNEMNSFMPWGNQTVRGAR
jgi:methylthioribose-1-phosphate isomerase